MCEAFGCLPSEAIREIEQGSAELVWRILDLRAFARAVEAKNNPSATIEEGPMRKLVLEVEGLAVREERDERRET